jgi:hypothetical protein
MKKYIYSLIGFCAATLAFVACTEMNDMHDEYLRDGEKTYIGRVDSIHARSGYDRILIQYWVTDPRAKQLQLIWNQRNDTLFVDIPEHEPTDQLEVLLGSNGGNGVIEEGDHTLFLYTHDHRGHRSVVFEQLINVYGAKYQSAINNRSINSLSVSGNDLSVVWGGSSSNDELGVSLLYTDRDGAAHVRFIDKPGLSAEVLVENVDFTRPVQYQSLFLPKPNAIDTFKTDLVRMVIKERINVALHKNVVSSDDLSESYTSVNAVDGKIENASRWVSDASHSEHWLEIDLGQPYAIDGFKSYVGSGGSFNYPIDRFELQARINGEWQPVVSVSGNSDAQYGRDFDPVTTDKIRYYVPAYNNNQVRLYELEVFSTIEY